MRATPTPQNEADRLEALAGYGILDATPDPDFDALVNFIASLCGTPMAAISLVAEHRQWFLVSTGLAMKETAREIAFCSHAIATPTAACIVPDAIVDPRFAENPLVTGEPRIRFYAGMPIVSREGHALGTICVMDRRPRTLSELQLDALSVAARLIMTLIEHKSTTAALGVAREAIDAAEAEHLAMVNYLNKVEDERVRVSNELHAETSRRTQFESELDYSRTHDALTTLPNRRNFMATLEAALTARDGEAAHDFAVYVIDIDHCKQINDTLGNAACNELLVQCGERLLDVVHGEDVVARLDSDTFTIMAFDIASVETATVIAGKIRAAFEAPWRLGNVDCTITASVGIVVAEQRYRCAEDVVRDANIAMYHSKQQGRDRYSFFREALGTMFASKVELDRALSAALANDEFQLAYQPIVSLARETRRIDGFEALMRWKRPDGVWVSPIAFIPAAEESGLIVPLGAWALRTACVQLGRWRNESRLSRTPLQMSVNVSAIQLAAARFRSTVRDIIEETGIDPRDLVIEVTESAAMQDPERSIHSLSELRKLGIGIHVDDFGTGYSSLSYLRRLPVTRVKIDRSFVSADGRDDLVDPVIVRAIISLAHQLNVKVIAEGVETLTQWRALKDLGCDFVQGYYISRPVLSADATAFIQRAEVARRRRAALVQ